MRSAILLIADRPESGRKLVPQLEHLGECRVIGLDEQERGAGAWAAIVTDVDFRSSHQVECLRRLLSKPRAAGTPVLALLRHDGHGERVQAGALGAASLLPPRSSPAEIAAALSALIQTSSTAQEAAPADLPPAENIKQAGLLFGDLFRAAGSGEPVSRKVVEEATDSVMAAISEGGIKQWLELVWTYDDVTYQHCMTVTGLAAEFAGSLQFSQNDQKHLIRGALLHDVGKAKIPLAILNKPGRLAPDELQIMRTHAAIGFELLHRQGHYEPELLEVVHRHHELLDGSGYPGGLSGSQINDLVRLTTICDIYAALIERRPYKQPMQPAQAFQILDGMGDKLEPALVRAFARVAENSAAPALVA